jgi:hypothetical protein
MKLYKVLNSKLQAKDGGNFDYSKYIESGEFVPEIENIKECSTGYHVTEFWNMWLDSADNRIFEVEVKGLVENNEVGVKDKYVCSSFKFLSELKVTFDNKLNIGQLCTGEKNSGNWNSGYSNSGDSNSGYSNSGDSNSGDSNSGNWNSGNWNSTNYESGCFNSIKTKTIRVFNKDCSLEKWNNTDKPSFLRFGLIKDKTYKESFIESFNNIKDKNEIELLLKLPNFNYKVFEEISGISKSMITKKLKELKA